MSYNRNNNYYNPRYGGSSSGSGASSSGSSKKYSSGNERDPAPNSSGSSYPYNRRDDNRSERDRDYYGGYRPNNRYDNKYNKYAPNQQQPTHTTGSSFSSKSLGPTTNSSVIRSGSNYYGSSSSGPNPKRRPPNDRYDSYTGPGSGSGSGSKYYSSNFNNSDDPRPSYTNKSLSTSSVYKPEKPDRKGSDYFQDSRRAKATSVPASTNPTSYRDSRRASVDSKNVEERRNESPVREDKKELRSTLKASKPEQKSTITGSRAIFGEQPSERRNSIKSLELKKTPSTEKKIEEKNESDGKEQSVPLSRSNTPTITDPKLLHLFDDDYKSDKVKSEKVVGEKEQEKTENRESKKEDNDQNISTEPKSSAKKETGTGKTSFSDYIKLAKTKPAEVSVKKDDTEIKRDVTLKEDEVKQTPENKLIQKEEPEDTKDSIDENDPSNQEDHEDVIEDEKHKDARKAERDTLFVPTSSESDATKTSTEKSGSKEIIKDLQEILEDISEAETDTNEHTPRIVKGRRLVRKKDYDEVRHKLKRKAVYTSDDEEEEEEEGNQFPQSDDQSGDERRKTGQRPYKMKRDSGGRSLLQRACKKGNLSDIENYLARGANANEKDFCGFTCLHEAALEGHTKVAKILIEHGANVNAQADEVGDSETPLIDAAENKHYDTVKLLLENGADPSIYNIDGFTALTKIHNEHAEEEGYDGIIKLLEKANAKHGHQNKRQEVKTSLAPNVVDDPNDTYFGDLIKKKGIYKFAAEGSKEVTANYFVSGNSLSAKPDILILAARNGHVELVDIILGLNPTPYDIDTENGCGCTALLASVGRGHIEVVESLLSKDADPFKKRKQDNLNAIEIARGSVHFDKKEIELIEKYMEKKLAKKSADVSKTSSRNVSRNVTEEEESDEEMEESKKRHSEELLVQKNKRLKKAFKKDQTPEPTIKEDSASPQPERKPKSTHASASPSPAPLTKAQEEMKAKNAEEARIWQEKVLAKKRARREMFLKLEKEKERKRKEEEEKMIEDAKKFAAMKEEARIRVSKEAEETSKLIKQQRERLVRQMTIESYPIGLRTLLLVKPLSPERILRYSPLYIFEMDHKLYVTDLQIALITGCLVSSIHKEVHPLTLVKSTATDKSKMWSLFFFMIGIDKDYKPENASAHRAEGHALFQNLLIHFIELDRIVPMIKREYPLTYKLIWGTGSNNRCTKVDLRSLQFETKTNSSVHESEMEIVIDSKTITETNFTPPKLRRRTDILKKINAASKPLW